MTSIGRSGNLRGHRKYETILFLPPELLALIFRKFLTLRGNNPTFLLPTVLDVSENDVDTAPLHTLSHVCQYWRKVVLGTPAFWTRIDGRFHDQMNVFLQRSQPMTVNLLLHVGHWGGHPYHPAPPRMASVISAHAERLHRLDLFLAPCQYHVVSLLAPLQAPYLQVLTLLSPDMYFSFTADRISREPLFNGGASSLRALAIMPVIDWMPTCTPFPYLTHLVIYFDHTKTVYHPFDILELLSSAPVLAFLHLGFFRADAPYSGSWHPPPDPVPLPHLQSLVFTSSASKLVRDVLSRLSFPETVFIRLQGVSDFGFNLPTRLPPISLHPVTSLDLSLHDDHVLMVADGPESGLWIDGHLDDRQGQAPAGTLEAWLALLHESLGTKTLAHITHLHVFVHPTHTFWTDILAHLPQVSHLKVLLGEPMFEFDMHDDAQAPPGAAVALQHPPSSTAVLCEALCPSLDPTALVTLPVLRELTISWEEVKFAPETVAAFPRLPSMLIARARAGHPVHHVVLQAALSCPLPDSDLGAHERHSVGDLLRGCADRFVSGETEYEVVDMGNGDDDGHGDGVGTLCMFVMRDVWKVEGEDEYWEENFDDRPHYDVRPWT
ncbi:hypothetical protein GSI_03151 [Ganoderma sinense ZZ0214-1]|uniref:Uncharacterized protein n=1 Tax=Ganoderma sinense ZZ0214-1 TaxID=1077348 RepID=A0A2G8SKT5_9APHY|nr:hypothetical protein GSI_03151 [Ganoderma sinense ZZ0214-1]